MTKQTNYNFSEVALRGKSRLLNRLSMQNFVSVFRVGFGCKFLVCNSLKIKMKQRNIQQGIREKHGLV